MPNPKTLILGLGNPILSDDGIGLVVAERLKGRVGGVDVISTPLTGLHLLDLMVGYDALFLIDAMIVRTYIVPAAMSLMGKWAWWAPGRLQREGREEKMKKV